MWVTAAGGAGAITDEDFNSSTVGTIPQNTVYDLGGFNIFYSRSSGSDNIEIFAPGIINGTRELRPFWESNTTALEFSFDTPVTAFSSLWNGINTGTEQLTITVLGTDFILKDHLGPASDFTPAFAAPRRDGGFFGVVSDVAFSTITFTASAREGFQMDDAAFAVGSGGTGGTGGTGMTATTAPEPSTLAILTIGSLAMLYGRRRKRNQAA